MKTFLLAVALLGTGLLGAGLCAPPQPPSRPVFVSHSSPPNFSHPHFPRPTFPHPNRNWDHGDWRVVRSGYWRQPRGDWGVVNGREGVFDNSQAARRHGPAVSHGDHKLPPSCDANTPALVYRRATG